MSAADIRHAPDQAAYAREGDAAAWGAIVAGAVAMTAVTLVLLLLCSAMGLSIVSPWSNSGASATTFAVSSAIGLVVVQWVSSALGGYLAGRLRTRSIVRTDEVYFRDTAHGFLAWAFATLLVASLMASTVANVTRGLGSAAATVAGGAAQGAAQGASQNASSDASPSAYYVDMLFRRTAAAPAADSSANVQAEAGRILAAGVINGAVPDEDRAYLAQLVASRSGLGEAEARQRVNEVMTKVDNVKTKAKEAADAARKAGIATSIFFALSLAIGAFVASVASAYGGHHRDEV